MKGSEPCMICYDEAVENTCRFYCVVCGKPLCEPCKDKCMPRLLAGMGCPHCRSTLNTLVVVVQEGDSNIILRLDGAHVTIDITRSVYIEMSELKERLSLEFDKSKQDFEAWCRFAKKYFQDVKHIIHKFLSNHERAQKLVRDRQPESLDSRGNPLLKFHFIN